MKRVLLMLLLSRAAFAGSVVLMPLDNVCGEQNDVQQLIVKAVEAKGWKVAGGEEIEALLETERVRYLDSIEGDVRAKIFEKSGASAILTVTLYMYTQGRNPTVGLSAHLIDAEGDITWGNVAAIAASDTERVLGLGKKTDVADVAAEAVDALMRTFPRQEGSGRLVRSVRTRTSAPHYISPELDRARPVCVLPFDNNSMVPDAPRVLADVMALRLEAAGFHVVDPAILRAAALKARVSLHAVGSQDLAALAKIVGTPLFLRGTIYAYNDAPSIDVEATLVDVEAAKVLWASQQNRKGTDYIGFLMLGAVSNSVSLSDRVATEMIATARTKHENSNHSGDRAPVASLVRKGRHQLHSGEGQR